MNPLIRKGRVIAGWHSDGRAIVVYGTPTAIKHSRGTVLPHVESASLGFGWGVSAPMSDLALAILALVLIEPLTQIFAAGRCGEIAWNLHMAFHAQFVAKWPDRWQITFGEVERWVDEQLRATGLRESAETVLVSNAMFEVRCPAFPSRTDYVRLVRISDEVELAYWDRAEWQFDNDLSCIGAIFGAIAQVTAGEAFSFEMPPESASANGCQTASPATGNVTGENEIALVQAALAALSQNATFPADIAYARRCLTDVVAARQVRAGDAATQLDSRVSGDSTPAVNRSGATEESHVG